MKSVSVIPQAIEAHGKIARRCELVAEYILRLEQCQTPAEVEALKAEAARHKIHHIFSDIRHIAPGQSLV